MGSGIELDEATSPNRLRRGYDPMPYLPFMMTKVRAAWATLWKLQLRAGKRRQFKAELQRVRFDFGNDESRTAQGTLHRHLHRLVQGHSGVLSRAGLRPRLLPAREQHGLFDPRGRIVDDQLAQARLGERCATTNTAQARATMINKYVCLKPRTFDRQAHRQRRGR